MVGRVTESTKSLSVLPGAHGLVRSECTGRERQTLLQMLHVCAPFIKGHDVPLIKYSTLRYECRVYYCKNKY